ncbi:hypothetical protein MKY24_23135 [Paenibacillus sp. FSL P2-0322]|uniref:hypothetical protein n=1 Tax=Paenibacillus sp. FSL P2-0322 TaxID=2921628 RepID=UPI0030CFD700
MNKRSIVPEDLYGYQWISDPTISPDGTIAYVNKSIDRPKNDYQTPSVSHPFLGTTISR